MNFAENVQMTGLKEKSMIEYVSFYKKRTKNTASYMCSFIFGVTSFKEQTVCVILHLGLMLAGDISRDQIMTFLDTCLWQKHSTTKASFLNQWPVYLPTRGPLYIPSTDSN